MTTNNNGTGEPPVAQKAGESSEPRGFASFADVLEKGSSEAFEQGVSDLLSGGEPEHDGGSGNAPAVPEEGGQPPQGDDPAAGPEATTEAGQDEPVPASVQKRIDELTAQKGHFQSKTEKLEAKLAELERKLEGAAEAPTTEESTTQDPFAGITSQQQLDQKMRHTESLQDWAEEQIERIEDGEIEQADLHGQPFEIKQLRKLKREARDFLRKGREKAMQLAESEQVNAQAVQSYPWLGDPESKEARIHNEILTKNFPELRDNPAARLAVADMMVGMAARIRQQQGGGQAPEAVGQAPAAPAAAAPAPAAPQGSGQPGMGNGHSLSATQILQQGARSKGTRQAANGGSPAGGPATGGGDLARTNYYQTGDATDLATLLSGGNG